MILPKLTQGMIIRCVLPTSLAWTNKDYPVKNGGIHDNQGRRWIADMNVDMEFEIIEGGNMKKSIMDVVNDLQGDEINSELSTLGYGIAKNKHLGGYLIKHNTQFVCPITEYVLLIRDLMTNFNTSCTYEEYKAQYKEDKPLVYTQEMCDNGELPPIDSEFMNDTNVKMICVGIDSYYGVAVCREVENVVVTSYLSFYENECFPLPENRAIPLTDGECYSFVTHNEELKGFFRKRSNEFVCSEFSVSIDRCENIKHLT